MRRSPGSSPLCALRLSPLWEKTFCGCGYGTGSCSTRAFQAGQVERYGISGALNVKGEIRYTRVADKDIPVYERSRTWGVLPSTWPSLLLVRMSFARCSLERSFRVGGGGGKRVTAGADIVFHV